MVRAEVKGIVEIVENEKIKIPDLFGKEGFHGKGDQALFLGRDVKNIRGCP